MPLLECCRSPNQLPASSLLQLFGDNFAEKDIEKTEEEKRRDGQGGNVTGTSADNRSLFHQLADNKEKKQEEFDALVHANRCRKLFLT